MSFHLSRQQIFLLIFLSVGAIVFFVTFNATNAGKEDYVAFIKEIETKPAKGYSLLVESYDVTNGLILMRNKVALNNDQYRQMLSWAAQFSLVGKKKWENYDYIIRLELVYGITKYRIDYYCNRGDEITPIIFEKVENDKMVRMVSANISSIEFNDFLLTIVKRL